MLSKVRHIGKSTVLYGFGNILNKSLGFILIPIYTRHIPIDQYGVLAILELFIIALIAVLNLGISSGHERYFYKEKEKQEYGKFLFSNILGLLAFSLLSLAVLSFFRTQISILFWGDHQKAYLVILVLLITFIEINNIIPFQILQYENKPIKYLVTNLLRLLLSIGATVYFVIFLQLGIKGIMYGRILGSGIIMFYQYLTVILPRISMQFEFSKISMTIRYGFPLTISLIGYLIFTTSDRFMLNWLSDERQTGMYGFGYKIANMIMLLVQSVGIGYLPTMYQQEKHDDNKRFYRKMLFYYTFLMTYLVLIFLFSYKIILWPLVQNKEYWTGVAIVPILSLTFLIMGMNYFVNIGLTLKNKTRYFIIPTFTAAIINIGFNFFFIKRFGFVGTAYAALISQAINTSLITIIANRFMAVEFEWKKISIIIILAFIIYILGVHIGIKSNLILAFVRTLLLIIFPIILYKLSMFEPIEIQRTKEGLLKLKMRLRK